MTFAVGIFDLFTYTIPGALYLGVLSYVAFRLHWVDPAAAGRLPIVVLVVIMVLVSYLLGYLAYPVGALLNRVPAARGRAFVRADPSLLLGALQLRDKDVAAEITRLRATGLMLRNSAPALVLGFATALVEIFASGHPAPATAAGALFAAGAVALVVQGRRLGYWASLKTLELAFWLPDVDEQTREPDNPH